MMTEAGCSKTSTLVMVAMMSMLLEADVPVRPEVLDAEQAQFDVMAAPGAVLSGSERVGLAEAARSGQTTNPLQRFAHHLYADPGTIHAEDVFAAVDATSDPAVVETIGVVARLSSVDRTHLVLNVALQPLPTPSKRSPTARVAKVSNIAAATSRCRRGRSPRHSISSRQKVRLFETCWGPCT